MGLGAPFDSAADSMWSYQPMLNWHGLIGAGITHYWVAWHSILDTSWECIVGSWGRNFLVTSCNKLANETQALRNFFGIWCTISWLDRWSCNSACLMFCHLKEQMVPNMSYSGVSLPDEFMKRYYMLHLQEKPWGFLQLYQYSLEFIVHQD